MKTSSLKGKATTAALWTSLDRIVVTLGNLLVTIVLARLLDPREFGLIAIIYVFLILSDVFVESGLGSALIQRKDATQADYSTIFVFNLIVSSLLFILLYVIAPFIASFYDAPELINLTRVLGITLVINALTIIQRAYLEKTMNFKSLTQANIFSLCFSSIFAISAAVYGLGVWALVIQIITNKIVTAICLHLLSAQKVSLYFSLNSFQSLFRYSSRLLLASLYGNFMQQLSSLVIGKYYSASQLGYFSQAKRLADMSSGILYTILNKVTFPILSSIQDDKNRMLSVYKQLIRMTAFISIPLIFLVAIMAEPLVIFLLGSKWSFAIPLLQWLSLAKVLTPISTINLNILNAIGRSDYVLKAELATFPVTALILLITVPIGIEAIAIGMMFSSFVSFFIYSFIPGRIFNYGGFTQIKDILKTIIASSIMGLVVFLFLKIELKPLIQLIFGAPIALIIFSIVAYLLRVSELTEIFSSFSKRFFRNPN